ncbi:unnamed protein product [Blepharisma stoltei]|uniref:Uncharacterized protein n=1 Tax=Blepharisma stoltei TaxID=1481888 RepID=A0AAU9IXI5_9CILI|nr:unnamed protein product [Blepharisma stoltei]
MIHFLSLCILTYTAYSSLSKNSSQNQINSPTEVFYHPETGEILTEEERQELKSKYIAVVDGIADHAVSDYSKYGFYSVSERELNEDIIALIKLYLVMAEDEIVVINNIQYDKKGIREFTLTDEDLVRNFGKDEVLIITNGESEFVSEEELLILEEEAS